MATIQFVATASPAHMPGLKTFRALPVHGIPQIDPFIFLNHHGPDEFTANNQGLPFGPHPHRGFETLTFILDGDVLHADSTGGRSVINSGGIQWMTAGSGIVHKEVSSDTFKQKGGKLEILQLWMNLPAKHKMITPDYKGMQENEIPVIQESGMRIQAISGQWGVVNGGIQSTTNHKIGLVHLKAGVKHSLSWGENRSVFLYTIRGRVKVNGVEVDTLQYPVFNEGPGKADIETLQDAVLLYAEGTPLKEPMVAHGPFVMNTEAEINQAIRDYQTGKMGRL
jgi:redox-sensitive bicupin YhaK (pirin superfamily)